MSRKKTSTVQRVADRAKVAWHRFQTFSKERWQEFKRQPKYFQYRVYIVAAYVGIAAFTVLTILPRGERNRLHAYVLASRGDFVLGTYIMVRNDSSHEWRDIHVSVNGTHHFDAAKLDQGQRLTIALDKLKGAAPLSEAEVHDIHIECSAGSETYPVHFIDGHGATP